jgi:hypothetical protein
MGCDKLENLINVLAGKGTALNADRFLHKSNIA